MNYLKNEQYKQFNRDLEGPLTNIKSDVKNEDEFFKKINQEPTI
jgi:hypothetical protein